MRKKYKYSRSFVYEGKRYYIKADSLEEIGRMKERKLQLLRSIQIRETHISVEEYGDKCISLYKTNQSFISRQIFEGMVRREIYNPIGSLCVKDVTQERCQILINGLSGYSTSYINKVYNALRFIFRYATAENLISKDPTANLVKPKGTYTPRRIPTQEEREAVISLAKTDRRYYLYLLCLYCGCRPSEAANCTGADIITKKRGAKVYNLLHIRGTKSVNADRYVPIPQDLYSIIKDTPKNEYIACTPSGKPIVPNNRQSLWRTFWKELNRRAGCKVYRNKLLEPYPIPKDLTPYCLRHEYCTNLARKGVDIRTAQKLMGHSDISLTANIYTHVETDEILAAADLLL